VKFRDDFKGDYSLTCDMRAVRHGCTRCHNFKEGKKNQNQNQIDNVCVKDLLHKNVWLQFIGQGKGRKCISNGLEPW
jgi:hypothetical protein